jgi:Ca2+-transporting ATPase
MPPGLSAQEARDRLARHGPNEIQASERRSWWATLRGIATEPMFVLLVGAAAVYLVLGDLGEGLLLAGFALVTVGLVILQERRSERALDALRELAAPQVRVVRDGRIERIAARELVPGDLFLVGEGERVAADAVLRQGSQVAADESLLTGESVPVRKAAAPESGAGERPDPGGQDTPFLYAATLTVSGHGIAEVLATGHGTRAGGIGLSLAAIVAAPTPLQAHLRRLVARLGVGALALAVVLVLGYGLAHGDWLEALLAGIAAAMSLLPEEFPMALSVFLALGAWRLAREKVLARRPAVIEALGAATVLCVDKTGTLTENRMRLRRLVTPDGDVDLAQAPPLPEAAAQLLSHGALASRRSAVDPMDRAVIAQADALLPAMAAGLLEREYPLEPGLLAMAHAWRGEGGDALIAAKGAPEAIVSLCHLPASQADLVMERVTALAREGLRVLAVARGVPLDARAPERLHDCDFEWLGLLAFEDPLRSTVPAAVAQARAAGIAVAMITGDHAATALAIAHQAGIATGAGALTGEQLARMDEPALREALRTVRVFARVQPEQKLRLVQALQANGEVVAMTGDGVNDAPALKAAHIGIAMGVRGTDVAREAAGLVLLDEDFSRIVAGVRLGRRIFDNLRRVMTYIAAIHVPIAGLALLPVLLGLPPLMLPAHVVLTEMIIDPICSLAFEGAPERPGLMQRPPRHGDESLLGWTMFRRALVQGGLLLAAALAVYVLALPASGTPAARGLALLTLTVGNLGLVWLNASQGVGWRVVFHAGYTAFWAIAALAAAALAAMFTLPAVATLLKVAAPGAAHAAGAIGIAVVAVMVAGWLAPARD